MARRLTEEDKKLINEVYAVCGSYAETARQTGFSTASVKKYVEPGYVPERSAARVSIKAWEEYKEIHLDNLSIPLELSKKDLLLTNNEKEAIKELKKGMKI